MHGRPHLRRSSRLLAGGLVLIGAVAGCSSAEPAVEAAPSASAPACGQALARAPATVLGHPELALGTAGALAWGPPRIVLRCGLPELAPTPEQCLTVDDVDWVLDDSGDGLVFTTFGRAPAVEVRVPAEVSRTDAPAALVDVGPVAAALPRTQRHCR